jgi:hypothetical protein
VLSLEPSAIRVLTNLYLHARDVMKVTMHSRN